MSISRLVLQYLHKVTRLALDIMHLPMVLACKCNTTQKIKLMNRQYKFTQYLYCLNISTVIVQSLTDKTLHAHPRSEPQKQKSHSNSTLGPQIHVKQENRMFLTWSNIADT